MRKHTPGPWTILSRDRDTLLVGRDDGNGTDTPVADCLGEIVYSTEGLPDRAERFATARLIAAAPDLLAQLKLCLQLIEDESLDELHGDLAECVRAAIANAE